MGLVALVGVKRVTRGGLIAAPETCEIAMRRADGDADFYARAVGPKGQDDVVARSPMFRWQGDTTPPSDGAVLAAHTILLQRLTWDGWNVEERGTGTWWSARLSRPGTTSAPVAGE